MDTTNSDLKATIGELTGKVGDEVQRLAEDVRAGTPSRPLFGVLPVARVIPQDVHSVLDYTGGVTLAVGALVADTAAAKAVGHGLFAAAVGASLLTDYRLSLKKVIPIEVHEGLDYALAFSAIAAPFALGYARKDPVATALHVAVGVSVLVGSLFTDYRSARGKRWGVARPDEPLVPTVR